MHFSPVNLKQQQEQEQEQEQEQKKIPVLSYTKKEDWLLKQFVARHMKTTYCDMSCF